MHPKYPRTPYWPHSPTQGRLAERHDCPQRFVGPEVLVTEKLDGGNTMIHRGEVFARSVTEPSRDKWMAMVRKHTAWKVQEPDLYLYGEDIYAVHTIEYEPVPEDCTFHAFAIRRGDEFASFSAVEAFAAERDIPMVPVLYAAASPPSPPSSRSSSMPMRRPPSLTASAKASYCASPTASRPPSSPETPARASGQTMSRQRPIGAAAGVRSQRSRRQPQQAGMLLPPSIEGRPCCCASASRTSRARRVPLFEVAGASGGCRWTASSPSSW